MAPAREPGRALPIRVGFLCETTLGHAAYFQRLKAAADDRADILGSWYGIGPEPEGILERIPPFDRIWSARAALRARRLLDSGGENVDVLFFHTVAPALLARRWQRRVPSVISVDATPANVDEVGAAYGHTVGSSPIEAAKARLTRSTFSAASTVIAWSLWVKNSLVRDYGIDAARIVVQPPGVPLDRFVADSRRASNRRVRLLFVGGDFRRKGGEDLLAAVGRLSIPWELDIVTQGTVTVPPDARVHSGFGPGDKRLAELYRRADIFVLPTRADTWGHAVVEAMAAGLPVVTTPVGALREILSDGEEGVFVPPGDVTALTAAIERLAADPEVRGRTGAAAQRRAIHDFDAARNLSRILDIVRDAAQ